MFDDDNYFIYDDELHPKRVLIQRTSGALITPGTLTTPPVILGPPPGISTLWSRIEILPLEQTLQRLPILLAQIQAFDTSENLAYKFWWIVYFLHQAKQISKTLYNNLLKSV